MFRYIFTMKKFTLVIHIIIYFIFSGCSPIEQIQTEILEPGEIKIPQKITSGVLILSEPENEFELVEDEEFPALIIEEMKYGLADVLENSPRFESDELIIPEKEEIKKYLEKDSLRWIDMKRIADQFNVDAVFLMDKFTLDSSMEDDKVYEQGSLYYYITFKIVSNARWRIYYPYQDLLVDEYNYSEKFIWDALGADKSSAARQLPDYKKAFFEAGYWTGHDYAERILPIWREDKRTYYIRGTNELREAKEYVDENNWEKAIETWKINLEHPDREIASRAAYNIAFAFEMMGDINKALKWAERSQNIKNKERTLEFIENLKQREEKILELEEQL